MNSRVAPNGAIQPRLGALPAGPGGERAAGREGTGRRGDAGTGRRGDGGTGGRGDGATRRMQWETVSGVGGGRIDAAGGATAVRISTICAATASGAGRGDGNCRRASAECRMGAGGMIVLLLLVLLLIQFLILILLVLPIRPARRKIRMRSRSRKRMTRRQLPKGECRMPNGGRGDDRVGARAGGCGPIRRGSGQGHGDAGMQGCSRRP
jgi:hypothetical protein